MVPPWLDTGRDRGIVSTHPPSIVEPGPAPAARPGPERPRAASTRNPTVPAENGRARDEPAIRGTTAPSWRGWPRSARVGNGPVCESVAAEMAAGTGQDTTGLACHVGDWDAVPSFGQVDALVNNAGIDPAPTPVVDVTFIPRRLPSTHSRTTAVVVAYVIVERTLSGVHASPQGVQVSTPGGPGGSGRWWGGSRSRPGTGAGRPGRRGWSVRCRWPLGRSPRGGSRTLPTRRPSPHREGAGHFRSRERRRRADRSAGRAGWRCGGCSWCRWRSGQLGGWRLWLVPLSCSVTLPSLSTRASC